jgi:hypothetical protein
MFRVNLSDSLLQTVFFPGIICLIAVGYLVAPFMWTLLEPVVGDFNLVDILKSQDTRISGIGVLLTGLIAVAGILAYLLAMFLGSLLAVLIGYFEYYFLDWWQARKLGIERRDEYHGQWDRYLDSLEKAHNSYVTKQVTSFLFQARSALALLILSLCILWSYPRSAIVLLALAAFPFKAAVDDHRMLAEFRKRRFGVKPDAFARPEEIVRALVDLWCKRSQVTPLHLVLPALTADGKEIPDAAKARDVLRRAADLPDTEVSPSEKCMLLLAIATLSERAR